MDNKLIQRSRKTRQQYNEEHELFNLLMEEGKPSLEIMMELGLTRVQFDRHLLDALRNNEIAGYQPQYEAVKARVFPALSARNLASQLIP